LLFTYPCIIAKLLEKTERAWLPCCR